MAINLELPRKMHAVIDKAHQGAAEMMRPIARKYDIQEHAYPVELDTLAQLFAGAAESNTLDMAGADGLHTSESTEENRNGSQHGSRAAGPGSQLGRRGDAAVDPLPRPGQRGSLRCCQRRAAAASGQGLGGYGDHRTRLRVGFGGGVHHSQARRRRIRDQRREDFRHRRFASHSHCGVGDAGQVEGPPGDQVVHRAARTPGRHRRAAGEQARNQGLRHGRHPVRQRPHPQGQPAG